MTAVDAILNQASRRLLTRIADTMETLDVGPAKIAEVRAACETTTFPTNWPSFLEDVQDALFHTAYSRYHVWRHTKANSGKRKGRNRPSDPRPSGSNKRATIDQSQARPSGARQAGRSDKRTTTDRPDPPASSQGAATESSGKKKRKPRNQVSKYVIL